MDHSKYLRDRAAEMSEFALTAPEPASSEFFKLASLCRDSADRVDRLTHGSQRWLVSPKEDAPSQSAAAVNSAETRVLIEDVPSDDCLSAHLLPR
jgi:hypothetical protein